MGRRETCRPQTEGVEAIVSSTVVYYTSNREDEQFEQKIRDRLLATIGDMPLISVSQKPIDFGKNICVGDVGVSNQNVFRQLQIGAQEAKTDFIISAEADCLYPQEYFEFIPGSVDSCYRYSNVWIFFAWYKKQEHYVKKRWSESAQIVGRDYLIRKIENVLQGRGMWNPELEHKGEVPIMFRNIKTWQTDVPVINIKTTEGMHKRTGVMDIYEESLPFWGKAEDLRKELWQI